ncbi:MAG: DNA methyltransferase [Caulobacteraceae bacterium]|nr:DNA methyltransferase [Caulobacteraceae bacterium]
MPSVISASSAPSPLDSSLHETLGSVGHGGRASLIERRDGVDFYFNEYWTARQRQAHALHEVSYRACFKPQLPAFFIERLTKPGALVYDPFMGRGTTPIQAALMGRAAIGNDINPLSVLLARPRLAPPAIEAVAGRLAHLSWQAEPPDEDDELLVFFHPQTLREIKALRAYLIAREAAGRLDAVDDWIRMVAMGRLTGHSPGFLSAYSMPPNQAVSVISQRRINAQRGQIPPRRITADLILRKSKALLKDGVPATGANGRLLSRSADHTPEIETGSVDLVVTSPPFLDVVDYAGDNWLRSWFAGLDTHAIPIAHHRKAGDWSRFIGAVFAELGRIVRPGGHVAFEVGEVRGGRVALETLVLDALVGAPFKPLAVVVNAQTFTKTANCWGVSNNAKGTNSNRIVLARRV